MTAQTETQTSTSENSASEDFKRNFRRQFLYLTAFIIGFSVIMSITGSRDDANLLMAAGKSYAVFFGLYAVILLARKVWGNKK